MTTFRNLLSEIRHLLQIISSQGGEDSTREGQGLSPNSHISSFFAVGFIKSPSRYIIMSGFSGQRNYQGDKAVHESAQGGKDKAGHSRLLDGKDIIKTADKGEWTALHKGLLRRRADADIRAVDKDGRTALHEAAAAGSGDAVKELLRRGANIWEVDKNGRTALHEAAAAGSGHAVEELLDGGANIWEVDKNGRTALHEAAAAGSENAVKELLDRGANIRARGIAFQRIFDEETYIRAVDNNGRTALHEAAAAGSGDAIKGLLRWGAIIRAVDKNGRTALHEAAAAGSGDAVKELRGRGAIIRAVDKIGRTALHEAAAAGSGDAVKELLDRGANIRAVDRNGRTALHGAAAAGSSSVIGNFLRLGAYVNAVDKNGRTALHEAARAGSENTVWELLLKRANIDMVDKNRRTARDEIRPGSGEVIETMLSAPIRYTWKVNKDGATVHKECGGAIGDILTISKIHPNGHCYIARSVSEFLKEFYPAFGEQILDWISKVYKNLGDHTRVRKAEEQLVNDICITLSKHPKRALVMARLEPQHLTLRILATCKEFALEVKSALSWMFASLQPRGDRKGLYSVTLDPTLDDWLPRLTKFSSTKTKNYCWINLFRYACISPPLSNSLYQPAKEGLEIDFDLLVKLAAVDREIKTDVGIILLGFDTALIPLEPPESKCWHFLATDGRQITPNRIKNDIDRLKLPAQSNMSNQYNTGMVYVGWCDNPLVKIGTTESEPRLAEEALMTSGVPDVKKLEELSENVSVAGLSLVSSVGFLGSALGISSGTRRQKMFRQVTVVAKRTPTNNFERVLDSACTSPYILWDNQTQRAWLLPAVSVLLFASLRYVIWKRYTFKRIGGEGTFKSSAFRYAEPSTDAKWAAVSCLRQNRRLLVEAADGLIMDGTDNDIFFEDIVRDIWLGMSEGEDVCSSEITGRKYEPAHSLLGYDLQEAICGPRIHLRTLRILDFMKSWKPLAKVKQVQVVFCRNVGPVITCNSSECSHACCEQQGTQGVLSCLLQDLKYFYGECWNTPPKLPRALQTPPGLPVGDNFEWVPRGSEIFKHLDEIGSIEDAPCACCGKLDRLQSITEIKRRHLKHKFKKSQSDNRERSGPNPFTLPSSPSSLRFGSVEREGRYVIAPELRKALI